MPKELLTLNFEFVRDILPLLLPSLFPVYNASEKEELLALAGFELLVIGERAASASGIPCPYVL